MVQPSRVRKVANSPSSRFVSWPVVLSVGLVLSLVAVAADVPAAQVRASQDRAGRSADPQPEPAIPAILSLFDAYRVVGIGSAHQMKDVDDFILALVRHPAFPDTVDDIVVECGNALYQTVLDRYIAGEQVLLSEAQQVWRNTTQPMCSVSAFYAQLFPLVRRVNQTLSPEKRLRVVAGDPPIDWTSVRNASEVTAVLQNRDAHIAAVMAKEVLAKRRKALMLFGMAHLVRGAPAPDPALAQFTISASAVSRFERNYPGAIFVIGVDYPVIGCGARAGTGPAALAGDTRSWPVPALVRAKSAASTSLALVDGYLYLGPPDFLLREPRPASVFVDAPFMAELRRRTTLTVGPNNDLVNVDKVREENAEPFLFCR